MIYVGNDLNRSKLQEGSGWKSIGKSWKDKWDALRPGSMADTVLVLGENVGNSLRYTNLDGVLAADGKPLILLYASPIVCCAVKSKTIGAASRTRYWQMVSQ